MKMVKSLLLGSAAGLVAMAGAQAADLPVKAKPVEYVKICSIYGAGFFYIPGTDTCIKIGGFIRTEWNWNAGGSFNVGGFFSGASGQDARNSDHLVSRSRALISTDIRSQTEFGTLRAYGRWAHQWTTTDITLTTLGGPRGGGSTTITYFDRAFIQIAGFTAGHAQSFWDNYVPGQHSYQTNVIASDTGGSGTNLIAYTAQFGNGFSGTLSLEDRRPRDEAIYDINTSGGFPLSGQAANDQRGQVFPDVVANLRVDQTWGFAQINGAVHDASAQYFGGLGGISNTTLAGHPSDKWGYAFGAGFTVNLPWAKGDTFGATVGYAKGALGYVAGGGGTHPNLTRYDGNTSVAVGWITDGVFTNPAGLTGGGIELTSGWSFYAGIEHYWMPNFRTSLHGGYVAIDYNTRASNAICAAGGISGAVGVTAVCDPDYSLWQIGSRTIWNPVPNLDIGLEVMYSRLNTAFAGTAILPTNSPRPGGLYTLEDQDVWSAIVRVQRNFWP
jgi:hypothetical protein